MIDRVLTIVSVIVPTVLVIIWVVYIFLNSNQIIGDKIFGRFFA